MDGWLIRSPAKKAAAGKAAKFAVKSSPVRGGKGAAGKSSNVPTRTYSGSSFAVCPVCEKNVPLALLQSVHLNSADCVKVKKTEIDCDKGSTPRLNVDARADLPGKPEQTCASPGPAAVSSSASTATAEVHAQKQWWTPEEQKRRKLGQPRTGSWWESAIRSIPPALHLDRSGAQPQDTTRGLQQIFSGAPPVEKLKPKQVSEIPGLYQIPYFINEAEESAILAALEEEGKDHWKRSMFNGECISQGWGVRTDLKGRTVRENLPELGERDLPPFLWEIVSRWKDRCALGLLQEFTPNEANANCYERDKGMHLSPHFDDRSLSGEVLVNLSLRSSCVMTFRNPKTGHTVGVQLPQRSLQVVSGKARFEYTHGIRNNDLQGPMRISITFRKAQLTAGVGKRAGGRL